jgi:hypothetical protein
MERNPMAFTVGQKVKLTRKFSISSNPSANTGSMTFKKGETGRVIRVATYLVVVNIRGYEVALSIKDVKPAARAGLVKRWRLNH